MDIDDIMCGGVSIFTFLIITLLIGACSYDAIYRAPALQKIEYAKQDSFFEGQHKLQCLSSQTGQRGNISGNVGILGGHFSGSNSETEYIKFIWINEKEGYLFPTVLPANKVRFNILNSAEKIEPYVSFSFYHTREYNKFDNNWPECINYAVISIQQNQLDNSIYVKFGNN